jgi:hypothetical protein
MGVSLAAPAPTLSPDKIPKFNAISANSQDVFDPAKAFPPVDAEAGRWLPSDPLPADQIAKQYADVEVACLNPTLGATAAQTAADLFVQAFGWVGDDGKALALDGSPPEVLVGALDQFDMAPPVISVM